MKQKNIPAFVPLSGAAHPAKHSDSRATRVGPWAGGERGGSVSVDGLWPVYSMLVRCGPYVTGA